jgi:hypothetical protein
MLCDVPQATSEVDTAKEKQTPGNLKYDSGQIVLHTLQLRQRGFRRTMQHGVAVVHARADDAASKCSYDLG